ncbi:MAG: hypothetical protein F6J94_10150 [Moorea sp. SIO1F2]|uniref:hypothetical protein n=1 Tax=Moorena sp. SIO1F2 TaxID=2607819 RepID=UPI0013B79354|nr:hypothetical protein [Moorena sp. SIO1F2]NET82284.1 hypothetical protein [Moorena sp. SIO1F2]
MPVPRKRARCPFHRCPFHANGQDAHSTDARSTQGIWEQGTGNNQFKCTSAYQF